MAVWKGIELRPCADYVGSMTNMVRETADTVYKTIRKLKPKERDAVFVRLLEDQRFREDLLDLATIEQRRHEPGRPLREYLTERKTK